MAAALTSWFTHPQALGLLALLPALATLWAFARRRRRLALAQLSIPTALPKLLYFLPVGRRLRTLALSAGLLLLILACAGPQWGQEPLPSASARGDVVVVLDVSRSMLAEQPSRLERALRSANHLADTLEGGGGRRVGLVVFAAQPKLWFPLTADYEHLRTVLGQIQKEELPPGLRPSADAGAVSGTRIGAALKLAVAALEPAREGQVIVLVSDGDDPAGDEEWLEGTQAARARHLPVHVVGVGDLVGEHAIPHRGGFLEYQGKKVKSKVNESVLQEIARRTGGVYLPAAAGHLSLGGLLADRLGDKLSLDEDEQGPSKLLVAQPRQGWFLWPALVLLVVSLVISERPRVLAPRWRGLRRLAVAAGVLLLVSAAPLPDINAWLRQGNAAFEKGDYDEALAWYEKAEDGTADPGLIAFNKAAAYFRQSRYREAELHYRRALEDQEMPAARRVRAWFDLGNARVKLAEETNVALLEAAVAAFRMCLAEAKAGTDLHKDARHNLELASLLWVLARTKNPDDPQGGPDPNQDHKKPKNQKNGAETDPKKGSNGSDADPKNGDKNVNGPPGKNGKKSDQAVKGPLQVLPDDSQLVPLSPQETQAHLERLADRILRERRAFWMQQTPPVGNVKDW